MQRNISRKGRLLFPFLAIMISSIVWVEPILLIKTEEKIERRNAQLITNELADTYETHILKVLGQIEQTFNVIHYAAEVAPKNNILDELSSKSLLPVTQGVRIAILDTKGNLRTGSNLLEYIPASSKLIPYSQNHALKEEILLEPIPSKSVVQFRRPLIDQGNDYRGFIIIEVDAKMLVRSRHSLNLGKNDKLGLITEDGRFLVRKIGNTISLGEKIDLTEFTEALHATKTGSQLQVSPVDNIERYVAIRSLGSPNYSMLAVTGLSTSELLAPLRQRAKTYYWGAFLANIVILILVGMLWRLNLRLYRSAARISAEQARSKAMTDAKANLERRIEERTQELVLANTQLREEFEVREKLETDLRLAQKLEAVGRLASGIAHEINTPVQYVGDNIVFLRGAIEDIKTILQRYSSLSEKCRDIPELKEEFTALNNTIEKLDLAYLLEDMPDAVSQALEGIQRISTIVRAMKEFSHPGGAAKEPVDLNSLIESTATVARNEWKYVADMEFHFSDSLPPVPGFSGELKQTVLNLIVNAAHAIEETQAETEDPTKGKITISTSIEHARAVIRISDTGKGISNTDIDKIFEPFFTTKEVGKGSGQGLAIAYSVIVEKHGGTLDVESTPGESSCFIIGLPLEASKSTRELE